MHEKLKLQQSTLGAVLSPDECYRVLQGLKTLPLRWERVSKTALAVGQWLEEKKKEGIVKRVLYPDLLSHPEYELAQKQFIKGSGSVISFELATEDFEKLEKFVDVIIKDGRIVFGESLASPETILSYPPLMSHKSLPKEERLALGISDRFFRLSVGFDEPEEIIASLEAGFKTL